VTTLLQVHLPLGRPHPDRRIPSVDLDIVRPDLIVGTAWVCAHGRTFEIGVPGIVVAPPP
jgi:hypothetical protein